MARRRKSAQISTATNNDQAPDIDGATTSNQDENPDASNDTKKARGRGTWAKGEKLDLFLSYKEMFDKHPGAMYEQFAQECITRWGYDLDPDEAPERGKVYETKDINEFEGEERVAEEERRAKFKESLRDKAGNAARYRWREKERRADSQGMSTLLKNILDISSDPPKKPIERQYYQKVYYSTRLKPGFDEYWNSRSKVAGDEKSRMKETNEYCDARWAKESEEFKTAMRKEMNENYVKEMKNHKDRTKWKDDAESYAKVWSKTPNLLPAIVLTLAKVFGSGCSIFLYGPCADGEITVDSVSATIPGAISRKDLSEFCPEVNARMHATCQQFAEALFSKEYCKSRKVAKEVPNASFEGQHNEAVGSIYRSVIGAQPAVISSPSLPGSTATSCNESPPSDSLNGNLTQAPTSSSNAPFVSTPAPFSTTNSSLDSPNGTGANVNPTQMKYMSNSEWDRFFNGGGPSPQEQRDKNPEGLMMGLGSSGNLGIGGTLAQNQSFDFATQPSSNGFPQLPSVPQTFSIAGQSFNLGTHSTNYDNSNDNDPPSNSTNQGYNHGSQLLPNAPLLSPLRLSGGDSMGGTTDTNARSPVHAHGTKDTDVPILSNLPLQHRTHVEKPTCSGKENLPPKHKFPDTEPIANTPPKRCRAKEVAQVDEDGFGGDNGDVGSSDEADNEILDDLDMAVANRRVARHKICPSRFAAGGPGTFGYTGKTSARPSTKKASTQKASTKKAPPKKASASTTAKKGGAAVGRKTAGRGRKAAGGNGAADTETPAPKKNARSRK